MSGYIAGLPSARGRGAAAMTLAATADMPTADMPTADMKPPAAGPRGDAPTLPPTLPSEGRRDTSDATRRSFDNAGAWGGGGAGALTAAGNASALAPEASGARAATAAPGGGAGGRATAAGGAPGGGPRGSGMCAGATAGPRGAGGRARTGPTGCGRARG